MDTHPVELYVVYFMFAELPAGEFLLRIHFHFKCYPRFPPSLFLGSASRSPVLSMPSIPANNFYPNGSSPPAPPDTSSPHPPASPPLAALPLLPAAPASPFPYWISQQLRYKRYRETKTIDDYGYHERRSRVVEAEEEPESYHVSDYGYSEKVTYEPLGDQDTSMKSSFHVEIHPQIFGGKKSRSKAAKTSPSLPLHLPLPVHRLHRPRRQTRRSRDPACQEVSLRFRLPPIRQLPGLQAPVHPQGRPARLQRNLLWGTLRSYDGATSGR